MVHELSGISSFSFDLKALVAASNSKMTSTITKPSTIYLFLILSYLSNINDYNVNIKTLGYNNASAFNANNILRERQSMIKKLYTSVQSLKAKNKKYWSFVYKINKVLVNILFPIYIRIRLVNGVDENSDVVISLTTYPARVKTVWVTIASLLNQTYKPAKVLLYLSKEQFVAGFEDLPSNLKQLQSKGLEIVFVEDDLKPHKKYFYAFKDYRDKLVMTADDDIFYPENAVENLVSASKNNPGAVICCRSHKIKLENNNGEKIFAPYNTWENNFTDGPDMLSLAVGCNGVMYRPALFDEEIFNTDNMRQTALFTDDLWLKTMEITNNIKTYNCSAEPLVYFNNIFTMSTGLWHVNTDEGENRNDSSWKKLMELYPEVRAKLINEEASDGEYSEQ